MTTPFEELWNHVWYQQFIPRHTTEFYQAKNKFDALIAGVFYMGRYINMAGLLALSTAKFSEPEWGFPKGRRRIREEDVHCAVREFSEETGFNSTDITLEPNFAPCEEVFFGTNHVLYRHVYFVARMNSYGSKVVEVDMNNVNQAREIRAIEWFSYDGTIANIRGHNQERKRIFTDVNRKLSSAM